MIDKIPQYQHNEEAPHDLKELTEKISKKYFDTFHNAFSAVLDGKEDPLKLDSNDKLTREKFNIEHFKGGAHTSHENFVAPENFRLYGEVIRRMLCNLNNEDHLTVYEFIKGLQDRSQALMNDHFDEKTNNNINAQNVYKIASRAETFLKNNVVEYYKGKGESIDPQMSEENFYKFLVNKEKDNIINLLGKDFDGSDEHKDAIQDYYDTRTQNINNHIENSHRDHRNIAEKLMNEKNQASEEKNQDLKDNNEKNKISEKNDETLKLTDVASDIKTLFTAKQIESIQKIHQFGSQKQINQVKDSLIKFRESNKLEDHYNLNALIKKYDRREETLNEQERITIMRIKFIDRKIIDIKDDDLKMNLQSIMEIFVHSNFFEEIKILPKNDVLEFLKTHIKLLSLVKVENQTFKKYQKDLDDILKHYIRFFEN